MIPVNIRSTPKINTGSDGSLINCPPDDDILFGRGRRVINHIGNKRFRD